MQLPLGPRPEQNELFCTEINFAGCLSGREAGAVSSSLAEPIRGTPPPLLTLKRDNDPGNKREVNLKFQVTPCKVKTLSIRCLQRKIAGPVTCPNTKIK